MGDCITRLATSRHLLEWRQSVGVANREKLLVTLQLAGMMKCNEQLLVSMMTITTNTAHAFINAAVGSDHQDQILVKLDCRVSWAIIILPTKLRANNSCFVSFHASFLVLLTSLGFSLLSKLIKNNNNNKKTTNTATCSVSFFLGGSQKQ